MTKRFTITVITITGLILVALILRNGLILALSIPLILTLLAGLIAYPKPMEIIAQRKVTGFVFNQHQPINIELTINNNAALQERVLIEDEVFEGSRIIDGQTNRMLTMHQGGAITLNYTTLLSRGAYLFTHLTATACDPFGLFQRVLQMPAPAEVIVLPATPGIRRQRLQPRKTRNYPGQIPSDRPGQGTEFLGIREYRPGDALRHISWRSNARHPQTLFTNEYRQEEMADFGIILDTRRLTRFTGVEAEAQERSVQAAAAFVEKVIHEGNRASLLVFGMRMTSVFPGSGKRQLSLLLRELGEARSSPYMSLDYLRYAPVRLFPNRSTLVVFGLMDDRDLEIYTRLRSFGYDIVLVNQDFVKLTSAEFKTDPLSQAAIRAARVERALLIRKFTHLGVRVVDWPPGQSCADVLMEIGRQLIHFRRA